MYNLGLVHKKLEYYGDALVWFEKLHIILPGNPEIIFQVADMYVCNQLDTTSKEIQSKRLSGIIFYFQLYRLIQQY